MNELGLLGTSFLGFAITLPRIAAAFLILPLLTGEIVPPLVRNVFLVSLAVALSPLVSASTGHPLPTAIGIIPLILKEVFIGLAIAYTFSIIFWALEGAGEIIDAKIGSTTAQIVDPILGHQTTLTASFFSRFAAFLFVALGGLSVFIGIVIHSYAIWPVDSAFPVLRWTDDLLFVNRFSDLVSIMLILAAPVLIVLSLFEFGLGLVNRFAEQLNVFALSLSAKAWISVFIIVLALGAIVDFVLAWIRDQESLLELLIQVMPPAA